ncbi:MAG: hypothetical protein ACXWA3_08510, partial [Acidimicrobiales bacterium]
PMPKLTFEGATQQELVQQVRHWLASLESDEDGTISVSQAIEQGAGLTKDAMRIIASAAPKPIAQNEVVKQLTGMGYKVTDVTSKRLIDGLDAVDEVTGGGVVRSVSERGRTAAFQMNAAVAKQILKALSGG